MDRSGFRLRDNTAGLLATGAEIPAWLARFEPKSRTYFLVALNGDATDRVFAGAHYTEMSEDDYLRLLYRLRGYSDPPERIFEVLAATPGSENLSERHRLYGAASMIDVDFVLTTPDGEPRALVEYKDWRHRPANQAALQALAALADANGIKARMATYWPDAWTYVVSDLNQRTGRGFVGRSEQQWVEKLYRESDRPLSSVPSDLCTKRPCTSEDPSSRWESERRREMTVVNEVIARRQREAGASGARRCR